MPPVPLLLGRPLLGCLLPGRLLLASCLALFSSLIHAAPIPAPPEIGATSYLLLDHNSGHVIASKNPDEPVEPASITKLMTVYVALTELVQGNIKLDEMVTVSEKAWRKGGSKMFIEVGKQVSVRDLLHGIIIQSGNDASIAIAEHIAGAEDSFAGLMNEHAAKLGMANSWFANSTGWPDDSHRMTARDIATLSGALIREFPEYYKWFSDKDYTFNGITQNNRNRLLFSDSSVDGLKTGHTEAAGYCLAASAMRNNMRLISVVLGTSSDKARTSATKSLLTYGFRFYETHKLYSANTPVTRARIWKAQQEQVQAGFGQDIWLTLPRGKRDSVKSVIAVPADLSAPVEPNQQIGDVAFLIGEQELGNFPLLALEPVPLGSFLDRFTDEILLMMQ